MYVNNKAIIAKGEDFINLNLNMLNRHGIITGATGTGKTITLKVIAETLSKAGIPTICGEEGMIFGGGTITLGINYFNLGKMTGQMAANVLNGADISTLPVQGLVNFNLVINKKKATENNIIIPEANFTDTFLSVDIFAVSHFLSFFSHGKEKGQKE